MLNSESSLFPLVSAKHYVINPSNSIGVDVLNNKILIALYPGKEFTIELPKYYPELLVFNDIGDIQLWIICRNRIYFINEDVFDISKKYSKENPLISQYPIFYSYNFSSDKLYLNVYIATNVCIHYEFNASGLINRNIQNNVNKNIINDMYSYFENYYDKIPFVILITPNSKIVVVKTEFSIDISDMTNFMLSGYYVPSQLLSRVLGLLMVKLAMDYNVNFEGALPVKLVFPGEYIEYAEHDSVWRLLLAVPVSASFDVIYKLIAIKYFETIYNFSRELLDILGLSNLGDLSVILDDLAALPFIEAFDIGTSYVVKWICDYLGLPYEYHYDTPTLPAYMVYWLTGNESLADEVYDVSSYFSFLTSYIYTNSDVVYPRVISSKYNIPRVLSGFAFGLAKGIEFSIVNLNPRRMYVVPEDTFLSCLPYPVAAPVSYVCDSGCLGMFPVPKILSFISFINSYHDSIVSLYGLLWYTLTLLKHGYIQLGLIFDILWTTVQSYIIKALTGVDVL